MMQKPTFIHQLPADVSRGARVCARAAAPATYDAPALARRYAT
jgi:hypothetical protein